MNDRPRGAVAGDVPRDGAAGQGGAGPDAGGPAERGVSFDPDAAACGQSTTPLGFDSRLPDVFIAFDRSGSMNERFGGGTRFSVEAKILGSLLAKFDGLVRFGFEAFPAATDSVPCPGGMACCADMPPSSSTIAPALGNGPQIIAAIKVAQGGAAVQTPTPHALRLIHDAYGRLADGVARRYVLLSTDGDPNCTLDGRVTDAAEACPETVAEIRALLADGIETIALGVSSDASEACMKGLGRAGGAPAPGGDGYYAANDPAALEKALGDIVSGIARPSCTLDLASPPPDAKRVAVFFDDAQVPWDPGHVDGWDYDGGTASITAYGRYCDQLQAFAVGVVDVRYGCPPCGGTVACP